MAVYDNPYSRLIALLKVLLPLVALAILSTLFLLARTQEAAQTLPYADVDVGEIAREQRLTGPTYAGMTRDGAAVTLAAQSARPDPARPSRISAEVLSARITLPGGEQIDLGAAQGEIDTAAQTAKLMGGVRLTTSQGYSLQTEAVSARLDASLFTTEGAVTGTGPLGTLNAGRLSLRRQGGRDAPHVLDFTDGVKLVYQP